jgi:butyryl-CoA dehydrogenase
MAKYMSMETLRFLMYDVHNVGQLFSTERYADYDRESIDIFLDAVKDFSDKELFPYIKEMDEKPAYWEDGKIIVHPQFETIVKQAGEMGLVGAPFDYEEGGMQMPATVHNAANFIMEAANNHVPGYFGLTAGAAHLLLTYATEEVKKTYVPKMLEMKWGGTMCLTEPQAGSSLSDITSTAALQEDGSYHIKGQKIFISSGDYEYVGNIVHLVLARIEGAPAGTKGISLFCVPKRRIEGDDLVYNNVYTAGEFEKLGQRGYCTTHIVFGEDGPAKGWLIGEANKGLKCMFQMMNEARIGTGRMGMAIASAAYYASLQYAKERPQGRKLSSDGSKNADSPQVNIIEHADVRRMLFLQKAVVEGSVSLMHEVSLFYDYTLADVDKERNLLLLELLTPIVKTYPAEKGKQAVDTGLQILGGYGFCMDFILQQYLRDIRIISIYEGTTGIQSQDLLGRKVTMQNGKALQLLAGLIQDDIKSAMAYEELHAASKDLGASLMLVQEVLAKLLPHAMKGNYERYLADATIFMDLFGTIVIGWQWLKIAHKAKAALAAGDTSQTKAFYESKVSTMRFFYKYEMKRTKGLAKIIMNDEEVLTIPTETSMLFD